MLSSAPGIEAVKGRERENYRRKQRKWIKEKEK
jgi:hypothetical protein